MAKKWRFKAGDRVWANFNGMSEPQKATIVSRDTDGGYGYMIKLDDWKNSPISYCGGKPWWFNEMELSPLGDLDKLAEV